MPDRQEILLVISCVFGIVCLTTIFAVWPATFAILAPACTRFHPRFTLYDYTIGFSYGYATLPIFIILASVLLFCVEHPSTKQLIYYYCAAFSIYNIIWYIMGIYALSNSEIDCIITIENSLVLICFQTFLVIFITCGACYLLTCAIYNKFIGRTNNDHELQIL